MAVSECPLWVRIGHSGPVGPMSALRQKQTLRVLDGLRLNCLRRPHPELGASQHAA